MASTADSLDYPSTCLNCATPLTGDHCHGCGQPAHVHRSIGGIGHDLMHGVLHLDGKLANTLPLLAFKPGQLTRRYIAGERRRFVSPLGMFLFSVTVLFLAMQVLGLGVVDIGEENLVGPGLARTEAALKEVAEAEPARTTGEGFGVAVNMDADDKVVVGSEVDSATIDAGRSAAERARSALPLVRQARTAWGGSSPNIRVTGVDTGVFEAAIDKAIKDPALVAYKLQANSYKFSWALIPLSVPFVWLLFFWRRDLGLYDHTVFVTYSIAAMTLLTIALMVLSKVGVPGSVLGVALCVLGPTHIWVHLRGSYQLSKRATLVRFLLLSVFIWFAVALFAVILFALGALG